MKAGNPKSRRADCVHLCAGHGRGGGLSQSSGGSEDGPPSAGGAGPPSGFSLLELLVVVSIIAVLAALIAPALARAKARAHQTVCLNRLRQWQAAFAMYAHDNEDQIPRESFIPGGTTWNLWIQVWNPLAQDVWYNALPPHLQQPQVKTFAPPAVRNDFYDRRLFYHCPSVRFPAARLGEVAYFSVAMNSKLILRPNTTIRFSSIQKPSSTVTFLDNRLDGEPAVHPKQPTDHLGQPSAFASRFVTRHLGRGTVAYADGHVDHRLGHEVVAEGYAIHPQTGLIWTADPALNPNLVE